MTEKSKKPLARFILPGVVFMIVLIVAVIAIAIFTINGATETPAPASLNAVATEGKALFVAANCGVCHISEGRQGGSGPRLSTTGYSDESFRNIVRKGRGVMPPTSTTQLTDDQLNKVIAYVRALKPA